MRDDHSAQRPDQKFIVVGPTGSLGAGGVELDHLLEQLPERLVAGFAIEVWRLRRRFERLPEESRMALRSIEDSIVRLNDILSIHEITLLSHDGQAYDSGLHLEVVEQATEAGKQRVVETVEPSVLWRGRVIRPGHVVLGPAED